MTPLTDTYERDALHTRWTSIYRGNPLQDRFNEQMMARVMAHLKPRRDALFLDAGCGTGDHAIRIARSGHRCIGIDLSETILKQAQGNVMRAGLQSRITLLCQALEELGFADESFDVIYCRGVLMHIPAWDTALTQLCRVLKPSGKLVIMEANQTSVETVLARLVRHAMTKRSRVLRTPAGFEYWSEVEGHPFVVRTANTGYLIQQLRRRGIRKIARWPTQFWDINRFPAGVLRNAAIRFNQLWFCLGLPSCLSTGNAILGEKGCLTELPADAAGGGVS